MSKIINKIVYVLLFLFLFSCTSVDKDAKKAAKLTNSSIEKTVQLKLEEAEKDFKKSQEIINKYSSHKKKEQFYELYIKYRDKGKKKESEDM